MKKRLLSLLMIATLAIGVLPTAVFAEQLLIMPAPTQSAITTTFTLETVTERWIDDATYEGVAGDTVYDAFVAVLDEAGYTAIGAENSYVTDITTPEGVTLSAYDMGAGSGWMYMVNGEGPTVGMGDFVLSEGDDVLFYYTSDWMISRSHFDDVEREDWYAEAVDYVTSFGLFGGTTKETFSPDNQMTRAMMFTVLHRMSGDTTVTGGTNWYDNGVNWAISKEISDGTNVNAPVTREQMITMLWRYENQPMAEDATAMNQFEDGDKVSTWAQDAMNWGVEQGLVNGKDGNLVAPQSDITRAEVATILMRLLQQG